jgi:hypothetical protein
MIAGTPGDPRPVDTHADALSLLDSVQRYAGWLGKDHVSAAVRADVCGLAAAINAGHETSGCLQRLDKDVQRLHGGGVRTMLRRALRALQAELDRDTERMPCLPASPE